jgi:hypothetical protein
MAAFKLASMALFKASCLFMMLPDCSSACEGLGSQEMFSGLGICRSGPLDLALTGVNGCNYELVSIVPSSSFSILI